MKTTQIKKNIFQWLIAGMLFLAGCAVPVSSDAELDPVTQVITEEPGNITAVVTETPLPTATPTVTPTATPVPTMAPQETLTPTPTLSPTPSPSPTPTEVPVYDQILAWESEHEPDTEIPVIAALLVNISENEVLYSDNATATIYPASITKLMTALVAFQQQDDFTETVSISSTAATAVIPSAKMCGFQAGDRILFSDLLGCMLIYSGNDTSVAVAEHISGSEAEFVALMNQTAEDLGLKSSYFCNSHGLPDDNHVTSAYDIYLIMQKLFNFDEFLGIIESGSIKVDILRGESPKTYSFVSTNKFFSGAYQIPEGLTMLGGKTGTTNKAGCCLSLYVRDEGGNCYIAEIFGAESYETLYPAMIQLLGHISEE